MFGKTLLLGARHHLVCYTQNPAFSKVKLPRPISGMFYLKMPCDLRANHQRICLKVGIYSGKQETNQNPMVRVLPNDPFGGFK